MKLSSINVGLVSRLKKIKLLVLDVDGVLTDGSLYFTNSGDEIKCFNSLDGQGLKMLQNSGITVAVITGRSSHIVERRTEALGIQLLYQGREDKLIALKELLSDLPHSYDQIAYMGDDYPDLPAIRRVGVGLTTANGHWIVKEHADWTSQHIGGKGAVREACDLIMLAQGTFDSSLQPYL